MPEKMKQSAAVGSENLPTTYLQDRIKTEAQKLLVPEKGERLNMDSFRIIQNQVEKQAEAVGLQLTKENIDSLIGSPEIQDAILNTTIIRLDTDTALPAAHVVDSRGEVVGQSVNTEEAKKIIEAERAGQ